jgi:hypothetical protein
MGELLTINNVGELQMVASGRRKPG